MRNAAFWLYLLFIVSWFLHLPSRLPILGDLRADLVLVLLIAGLTLASPPDTDTPQGSVGTRRILWLLIVYSVVTLPFVEWPGSVLWFGIPAFVKAAVFYFFTSSLVTDKRKLGYLLVVFVACQTFRVLEPTYLHLTWGYWGSIASMADWEFMNRLSGAPYDVINPNGLAFIILTVIPFFHYLGPLSVAGGIAYLAALPVCLYALVLTGSRSGMLGLAMVVGAIWLKSRRKLLLGVVIGATIAVTAPRLSDDLRDRYLSIVSSDTRNAVTARGRLTGVGEDFQIALRRPLFGHGLGTSLEANANFGGVAQRSHNLYTETAQEIGLVGLAIFVTLLVIIANSVRESIKRLRAAGISSGLLPRLGDAVEVWFAMNLLFSLASYGLSSYEWYLLAALCEIVARWSPEPVGGDRDRTVRRTSATDVLLREGDRLG